MKSQPCELTFCYQVPRHPAGPSYHWYLAPLPVSFAFPLADLAAAPCFLLFSSILLPQSVHLQICR